MLSSNNLLLPALIFAVVGFLVGILAMTLFSDRSKRKEKENPLREDMEDLAVPESTVLPVSRFESIAHIYREKTSGKIVTDVNGKVHLTHATIPPEQLSGLQESSRNWQNWLGMYETVTVVTPARPPEPVTAPPVVSPLPAAPPAAPPVVPQDAPAAAAPADTELPAAPPAPAEPPAAPVPPPAAPVMNAAPPARLPQVEKPRAKTMVGQIEDILQEMIPQSNYAGQEIHLTEDPTNGVIVWVGALKFTGINSVTDEGVRSLIQAAVRRWENTGGAV